MAKREIQQRMVIELMDDGNVVVTGPINNRILAYGMLGMAHDAIKDHNDKNNRKLEDEVPTEKGADAETGLSFKNPKEG